MSKLLNKLGKARAQLSLLATDPERFFRNWRNTRNPAAYQREMMEIQRIAEPCIRIDPGLAENPALNIVLPSITQLMTGGPNTAFNIAHQIAATGIPVRLVSVEAVDLAVTDGILKHLQLLVGSDQGLQNLTFGSCGHPDAPLSIGENDMFMATYWSTARGIAKCLRQTTIGEFFYLIQDFEPAFFPWSSNYALALQTYGMNFRAIINEATLAAYFCKTGTGRFADPLFIDKCVIFQPAVDKRFFFNARRYDKRPRRLLVYARPGRNLRGIGYDSLCLATADAAFADEWEFISIGGTGLPELALANGKRLRPAPWMSFVDYAGLIRSSDILLCLMLSPHTSYPALEMVASGGITVSNTFATKTKASFLALSRNFIVAEPEPPAIAACLVEAAERVRIGYDRDAAFALPRDWSAALAETTATVGSIFRSHTGRFAAKPVEDQARAPADL